MYAFRSFLMLVSAALASGATPGIAHAAPGAEAATVASAIPAFQPAPAVPAPLGRLQVLDPAPSLFAGPEAAGSALGAVAAPSGTLAELASARPHEAQPQRVSRLAAQPAPGAAAPPRSAPSGWMALLAGLAVIAFVAYRKLSFRA
jgi:hypothetical protein